MYNKTIIRFGFCDIQNNQGLGKGYRLRLITPTSTLVILDITKPHPITVYNSAERKFIPPSRIILVLGSSPLHINSLLTLLIRLGNHKHQFNYEVMLHLRSCSV